MDTLIAPTIEPDPIDQLVPPPRPWWVRLLVGLAVVGSVGVVSFLVGFGYLYPRPDCCGSGGGTVPMALAPDGESVTVQAFVFNSSGRALDILSADVDLPGATVLEVGFADSPGPQFGVASATLPTEIRGTTSGMIVIRFVPDRCSTSSTADAAASDRAWGTVDLRLDVVNDWLPSIDRTYRLPDPVFEVNGQQVGVFPPDDDQRWYEFRDPLAAACALLAGTPA
ncbi:MAG: hypothetical protein NTZ21_10050 [Actinobacteria bacterium]|nr:hypothetical protein [Actinomycetota bacterium]